MRVLIDTNIILDFFLEREPFFEAAAGLFDAIAEEKVIGFVSASSITDIFYICRRQTKSFENTRNIIFKTLALLEISPVDGPIVDAAISSEMVDFEDAVQVACAKAQHLEAIITRNPQDFQLAALDILSPNDLLQHI